jgi:hypothetical protein
MKDQEEVRESMPTEEQIESEASQHDAVMQILRSEKPEMEIEGGEAVIENPNKEEISIGKRLIGNFNPDGDENVLKAKQMCADLIDMVVEHQKTKGAIGMLVDHTISEVLNAQMNVVKILTYKE